MIRSLSELKTVSGKTMKQLKQVMVAKGLREDNRKMAYVPHSINTSDEIKTEFKD